MPIVLPPAMQPLKDPLGAALATHLPQRGDSGIALPEGLKFVFIVFTDRSGSTLLGELLATTGFFNHAEECLNKDTVLAACAANNWGSFGQYFAATAVRHAKNGHFLLKSSLGQLGVLALYGLLDRIVGDAQFLIVERLDKVAQAVSCSLATQAGTYTSRHDPSRTVEPVYDSAYLRTEIDATIQTHATMAALMSLNGLRQFHITYETLTSAPATAGALACTYLGQPGRRCVPQSVGLERQASALHEQWRARFLAEQAGSGQTAVALSAATILPSRAAPRNLSYPRTTLSELATEPLDGGQDCFCAARFELLPSHTVAVPPLTWGDTDFSRPGIKEVAAQGPGGLQLRSPAVAAWMLRKAAVLGRYGMVTINGRVLSDTLYHVPLHKMPGAGPADDGTFLLPDPPLCRVVPSAYHLLACNQDNYFHWLFDCVFRYHPDAYEIAADAAAVDCPTPIVMPLADTSWKAMSMEAAVPASVPRIVLSADDKLTVEQLLFVPDLTGAGFNPHPALLAAYDRVLVAVTGRSSLPLTGRRLYISRADSQSRVLSNESEIQAVAEGMGCTSVMLSDLSFPDQVRLFAEASLIVAPHGAGLTNIGFCRPGTTLCELHMDSYVHWSFRRLAALRGLKYGCLIGETCATAGPAAGQKWRLDPVRLRDLLVALVPATG